MTLTPLPAKQNAYTKRLFMGDLVSCARPGCLNAFQQSDGPGRPRIYCCPECQRAHRDAIQAGRWSKPPTQNAAVTFTTIQHLSPERAAQVITLICRGATELVPIRRTLANMQKRDK